MSNVNNLLLIAATAGGGTGREEITGVVVALDDGPLVADPDWTRVDNLTGCRLARWEVKVGRQDELEKTGTSEATLFFNDTNGTLDPTNTSSVFHGKMISRQAAIGVYDPVAGEWFTRFRGFVDDIGHDLHPSQRNDEIAVRLVGMFDYLANAEMAPGTAGHPPPEGGEGDVFFEDADQVWLRMAAALEQFAQSMGEPGFPASRRVLFTGNVGIQETVYPPGTPFLTVLQDAADAEWPGVANLYEDRHGRVVFHGRRARFNPEATAAGASIGAWDFTRWKAGDGQAVAAESGTAQIRGLDFDEPRKMIVNAALAAPQEDGDAEELAARMEGQVVTDTASMERHGPRTWSALDLLTEHGNLTGNDKWDETRLFAAYYVENFKQPRPRPRNLVCRAMHPDWPGAEATWAMMTRVDISDVVMLKTTHPGGGGFDEGFFIEGITVEGRPLGPYPGLTDLTVTLDVSPEAHWSENVFEVPE